MSDGVDVLLIGLGSIGTIYSYLLERSGKVRVTAVARSSHALYSTTGATLETDRFGTIQNYKPHRVVRSQEEALATGTPYALCIATTKSLPDILPTPTLLAPSIAAAAAGQIGAFALIQNGVGVEAALRAALPPHVPLVSCLAWITVMPAPDGKVVTWRGVDKTGCGVFPAVEGGVSAEETEALEVFEGLLSRGGGNVVVSDNIESMRYAKNVWTATWAGLQGLVRNTAVCFASLGPEHHAQIVKFQREVLSVGFKSGLLYEGMTLQPAGATATGIDDMVVADFDRFVNAQPGQPLYTHRWSLLVDIENDRPFEVEVVIGSVVALAREHGVETPLLDFVYTLLKGLQASILAKKEE